MLRHIAKPPSLACREVFAPIRCAHEEFMSTKRVWPDVGKGSIPSVSGESLWTGGGGLQ